MATSATVTDIRGELQCPLLNSLRVEMSRAKRHGHKLSVICVRLEYAPQVTESERKADSRRIFSALRSICADRLRDPDFFAPVSPELFVMALPDTDADGAYIVAGRLMLDEAVLAQYKLARDRVTAFRWGHAAYRPSFDAPQKFIDEALRAAS